MSFYIIIKIIIFEINSTKIYEKQEKALFH
jgi:hypothetical protein